MSARYDESADFYAAVAGDDVGDPVATALLELVPDLDGLRVLDLACGHGRFSRELARRGAHATGVDVSSRLLEKARAAEEARRSGVTYLEADATSADVLVGASFDAITCHFGLSDVDDLRGLARNVRRWLEPGGCFAFSILHPCFPGWGDDAPSSWPPGESYFSERWWLAGNSGFRGKVGSNHRTLSTYLNTLAESGLALERVCEPRPTEEWVRKHPSDDLVPVFLVMRCRPAST